ncbi:MAG: class F sortase [Candidatus Buchananbacteria bacterium]
MGNTQNESSGINLFVDPIISDLPASSMPTRLKIPKINVDASLEPVGLTTDGAMDVPKNQDSVAWLKLGPRPGEIGSAVMAGHYGWKDQKPSAFDNLYKLRQGDKLYVENDQGETISFVVHNIRRYKQDDKIANVFHSNDKKSHLNLITCEGTWNDISKSYPIRLVVFCDKE